MKISFITNWNDFCGLYIHAKLLFLAFKEIDKKIKIKVYSPIEYFEEKTRIFLKKNERFVFPSYSFIRFGDQLNDQQLATLNNFLYLDKKIFSEESDLAIIEKPTSLPLQKFYYYTQTFKNKIKKLVAIVHEGKPIINDYFYKIDWDKIFIFDERYKSIFLKKVNPKKITIFPFPCFTFNQKTTKKNKKIEKILIIIKIPFNNFLILDSLIKDLKKKFTVNILYSRSNKISQKKSFINLINLNQFFLKEKISFFLLRNDPFEKRFLNFFKNYDLIIFLEDPNQPIEYIPVSSFASLILNLRIPIICPNNAFFYPFASGEVIKYKNFHHLHKLLINIENYLPNEEKINHYLKKNSNVKLAKKLLQLI